MSWLCIIHQWVHPDRASFYLWELQTQSPHVTNLCHNIVRLINFLALSVNEIKQPITFQIMPLQFSPASVLINVEIFHKRLLGGFLRKVGFVFIFLLFIYLFIEHSRQLQLKWKDKLQKTTKAIFKKVTIFGGKTPNK